LHLAAVPQLVPLGLLDVLGLLHVVHLAPLRAWGDDSRSDRGAGSVGDLQSITYTLNGGLVGIARKGADDPGPPGAPPQVGRRRRRRKTRRRSRSRSRSRSRRSSRSRSRRSSRSRSRRSSRRRRGRGGGGGSAAPGACTRTR
jgi:hypothetical protein